ncbi:MAG: tRNA epoxyqueuosine(34) reductase QueG [Acidimicrobiales bacterium]
MRGGPARAVPDPAEILELAPRSGNDVPGFADASAFGDARAEIERRKAAGLHGGMAFTYRNPSRSTDPSRALEGAHSLVVGARSYRSSDPPRRPRPTAVGTVARYSRTDHYLPLRQGLEVVAGRLRSMGWAAKVLVDDNALVDRAAAYRAGLGWFGKNTVLLLPGRGSWFVLGSVVTDAPLAFEPAPAVPDGCGTCTRCMIACPTGALDQAGVLDARRCLAWLLEAPGDFPEEHRAALGGRIYGCDVCQEVCPVNRRVDRADPPPPAGDEEEAWVDLVELLRGDDSTLLNRFGRWYIPGRDVRHVRRNALVALGNVGQAADPSVQAVLADAMSSGDPMLSGHARWAAERLTRTGSAP